jgi:hypothetical protein
MKFKEARQSDEFQPQHNAYTNMIVHTTLMIDSDDMNGSSEAATGNESQSQYERAREIQELVHASDTNEASYVEELHTMMSSDNPHVVYEAVWGLNFISLYSPQAMIPLVEDIVAVLDTNEKIVRSTEKLDDKSFMTDEFVKKFKNHDYIMNNPDILRKQGRDNLINFDIDDPADVRRALNLMEEWITLPLSKLTNKGILHLLDNLALQYPSAVDPVTDDLIRILQDEWYPHREKACRILGFIGSDEAVEALEDHFTTETSPSVRYANAIAILMNSDAEYCIHLLKEFDGEYEDRYDFIDHIREHKLNGDDSTETELPTELSGQTHPGDDHTESDAAERTIRNSMWSAYVASVAENLEVTAQRTASASECSKYLKDLRDTLVDSELNGDTYDDILSELNKLLQRFNMDGSAQDFDDLDATRIQQIEDVCHRVTRLCQRHPET